MGGGRVIKDKKVRFFSERNKKTRLERIEFTRVRYTI